METLLQEPTNDFRVIHLISTAILKPHEKCCPDNLQYWLKQIRKDAYWTRPLLVDKSTNIIMDGHHRFQIAKSLALKVIPCVLTSYSNPYLKVYSYSDNSLFDKERIIEAAQTGKLFDRKSTRHELTFHCIPQINIPLKLLQ